MTQERRKPAENGAIDTGIPVALSTRVHDLDVLTGLPNRQGLASRLDHAMAVARREGKSAAVLFVDFDGFKAVNDIRGHAAGDAVLRALAVRLRARLRDTDTLARLGGDEFVVVAERVDDGRQAAALARKLLAVIADPVVVGGEALSVTASIGISLFPGDGATAEALIAAADAAMYAAKADGRDAFRYFSPSLQADARARLALEEALRAGLLRDEFALQYQPEWDVALGRVSGCQAQLRWRRPLLGVADADEFMPVADQCGASVAVGRWMLDRACADAAYLRAARVSLPIAVPLSARQLADRTLVGDLGRRLQAWELSAEALRIEVGEAALAPLARDVGATLRGLHALGVPLVIAQFGAGCSSIGALTAVSARGVRLAATLAASVGGDAPALAAAIVAMSRPLGLRVVATGVDCAAAAERLTTAGCHVLQGELVAPALPLADLVDHVRSGAVPAVTGDRRAAEVWTGRAWRATAPPPAGARGAAVRPARRLAAVPRRASVA